MMMRATINLVLYHYPCADGAFAAYAVHLAQPPTGTTTTTIYVPHRTGPENAVDLLTLYQKHVPDQNTQSNLYLLDYCGPNAMFIQHACSIFTQVYLLDHHKTAVDNCWRDCRWVPGKPACKRHGHDSQRLYDCVGSLSSAP
jgi:hypothetical protein